MSHTNNQIEQVMYNAYKRDLFQENLLKPFIF